MPTSAFIVHVNLSDVSQPELAGTASDIYDDLLDSGFDVVSVEPWARPSQGMQNLESGFDEGMPPLSLGL